MMKALLLLAHGSRRASSNDEIRALAMRLRRTDASFDLVEHAFLEMAAPGIAAGIGSLIAAGAADIVVLPYLLAAGRHVAADIPAEVESLARRHPHVRITLAPHLGAAAGMPALIHEHLRHAAEGK